MTVYNVRKKKMQIQSELMDSDLTACRIVKVSIGKIPQTNYDECVMLQDGSKVVCSTMEGVLYFFNWKEFGNMSDRFPGHPGGIECLERLNESLIVTGCEDGKIRYVGSCFLLPIVSLGCSAVGLYPHRVISVIGRSSTMPIQTLSTSIDTDFLVATSTSQETLQVIDTRDLKTTKHTKKKKGGQRHGNSFFADLEPNEPTNFEERQENASDDDDDDEDESDSDDEEMRPPPKKKKTRVHF